MKTVCICSSFRHYEEMLIFQAVLREHGLICEWPTVEGRRDPKTMSPEEAKTAHSPPSDRMDRADAIFVYNKNGYVGNSVMMEIGYAYARRKPVYALAPIADPFLMSLLDAVVSAEEFLVTACT